MLRQLRRIALILGLLFSLASCAATIRGEDLAAEYFNLANAYFDLGRIAPATDYYLRALELDPSLRRASYNLARVYIESGRLDDAREILSELLEEDPENILVRSTLAYAYGRSGDYELALASYESVLDQSPLSVDALYNAALVERELERASAARARLEKAYELSPEDPDVLRELGDLAYAQGDFEAAVRYLAPLGEDRSDELETWQLLADSYRELSLFADALEAYEHILERDRQQPGVWFAQAEILLVEAEEIRAGLDALEVALELGPPDAEELSDLLNRLPSNRALVEELIEEYGFSIPDDGTVVPLEESPTGESAADETEPNGEGDAEPGVGDQSPDNQP
jgi:FimV-like protein